MKLAIIMTTVNVPRILEGYYSQIFIAADERTPREAYEFCATLPNCEIYSPDRQKELGYECSSLLGWNTIARRNIALLEALKWGADLIYSIDDDNIPLVDAHWWSDFTGPSVDATAWFDPASLQFSRQGQRVVQRGFPQEIPAQGKTSISFVRNAKVGIAQGMVLGDPDTSAVDRISQSPEIHLVSELIRSGVVLDPRKAYAPLNSQNLIFTRELAPCFLMVPQFQRYDDIFASFIAQRYCELNDLVVHFGKPFVWQQRNPHNLVKDLEAEMFGMRHTLAFRRALAGVQSPGTALMWNELQELPFMPDGVAGLGAAWASDIEKVVK